MSFEFELSKGNFFIPVCSKCKKTVWPPSENCNSCLGEVFLKKDSTKGKIIEFSRQNTRYFCIVEFDKNFRIIAKTEKKPELGQMVKISNCGITNGEYFFEIN